MAIETYEVTCRYTSEEEADNSIRLLARNGWTAIDRWYNEGTGYYYVKYRVPRTDESVLPGPGVGDGGTPNP